ncbi:hypothetical protein V6M85_06645 [Sulfolobus tengchongensis]|uniref:Uncharacterized protein n=1 Tax=Sulfolobus tengchongensis TaxID=207809 RepID=A0AAX4KWQ0_9CREN
MGVAISDIRYLIEQPEAFGFKLEISRIVTKDIDIENIKQNGIRIDNLWIKCNKDTEECEVVDDSGNLSIVNFPERLVVRYVLSNGNNS